LPGADRKKPPGQSGRTEGKMTSLGQGENSRAHPMSNYWHPTFPPRLKTQREQIRQGSASTKDPRGGVAKTVQKNTHTRRSTDNRSGEKRNGDIVKTPFLLQMVELLTEQPLKQRGYSMDQEKGVTFPPRKKGIELWDWDPDPGSQTLPPALNNSSRNSVDGLKT